MWNHDRPVNWRLILSGLVCFWTCAAGAGAAERGTVTLRLQPAVEALVRGGSTRIDVVAEIQRGWHIQAHRPNEPFVIPTELTFVLPAGVTAETVEYPAPESAEFAFAPGKTLLVYAGRVTCTTSVHLPAGFPDEQVPLEARLRYQACNDDSCLPPATASARLVARVTAAGAEVSGSPSDGSPPPSDGTPVGRWLDDRGYLVTFALVALLGLGLNLTPCVYPLVSVTVSFFGGQSRGTRRRIVWLALVYVGGIALSFSAFGVAAALSGGLFGAALQRPAVLIGIAAVMVALALSAFGLYSLQPPAAAMRFAGTAGRGPVGALFMGLTMGIVAAPCIGPVVVGLLVFVGSRQDPVLGFALFLALSLGMGLPYVALAVAAGSLGVLPRSGEWLQWTERLFGFVLLALAAYFVAPVLPEPARRFALPAMIAVAGVYLGFVDSSGASLRYFAPVKRAAGVAALVVALWWVGPQPGQSGIDWRTYSRERFAAASASGRPVVMDFVAEWCLPCREMDRTTYADPEVVREAERFQMFKADLTEENHVTQEATAAFDVRGVPTTIVFGRGGAEVDRRVGYVSPDAMLRLMRNAR